MSLLNLIPGIAEIKTGIGVALIAAILGGVGYVWLQLRDVETLKTEVSQLQANNKILTSNNATIQSNFAEALAANKTNQATIASLLQERAASQAAVTNLASQTQRNIATITQLQAQLSTLSKNPSNDGAISADLKAAIQGIQGASK